MASISEKIIHPGTKRVYLHSEGAFWVAYEQSAFYLAQRNGYDPTKMYVKAIGDFIVGVTFPDAGIVIEELRGAKLIAKCKKKTNVIEIILHEAIDEDAFKNWKLSIKDKSIIKPFEKPDVEALLMAFPLAKKTPMEAFIFIKLVQDILHYYELSLENKAP